MIPNYFALHRSRDEWGQDANEFKPERWLELEKLPSDAFYPFSAGSHACPGKKYIPFLINSLLSFILH